MQESIKPTDKYTLRAIQMLERMSLPKDHCREQSSILSTRPSEHMGLTFLVNHQPRTHWRNPQRGMRKLKNRHQKGKIIVDNMEFFSMGNV